MDIYQQLAIDIYSAQTDEYLNDIVYSGLSRKPESDTQLEYFIKLVEALLLNKSYVHVFKPAPGNKDICANFNGVVISRNEFSHAWEPYLIVVKKEKYSPELADKILNGTNVQLSVLDTQILKRPKPRPDVQSQISIHVEFGEEVKEGDVLVTIGYLKINSLVEFYKKRFDIVNEFCSDQIIKFRTQADEDEKRSMKDHEKKIQEEQRKRKIQQRKEERANHTLYDVWSTENDPAHKIYFRLLQELSNDDGDFILVQQSDIHFTLKENNAKVKQGHYAGLFYVCAEHKYITDLNDTENIERALVIMQNTCKSPMSRDAFDTMKKDGRSLKNESYKKQVKNAFKKILRKEN
jgi:hypothetical protein